MEQISKEELMEMMEQASTMRDKIETRLEKARASSRQANYQKYHYMKQHNTMIEEAIQTPARYGDWSADLCTMKVEEGMEIIPRPINKPKQEKKKASNNPKRKAKK